jgi:hypothetical protein
MAKRDVVQDAIGLKRILEGLREGTGHSAQEDIAYYNRMNTTSQDIRKGIDPSKSMEKSLVRDVDNRAWLQGNCSNLTEPTDIPTLEFEPDQGETPIGDSQDQFRKARVNLFSAGNETGVNDKSQRQLAKAQCKNCAVRGSCLNWALENPSDRAGGLMIRGGTTAGERRNYREELVSRDPSSRMHPLDVMDALYKRD